MRPRTKDEKNVVLWSNSMPAVSEAVKSWAFDKLMSHTARYYKNGKVWCLCCGHIEHIGGTISEKSEYVCPKCGAKTKLEYWKTSETKNNEYDAFIMLATSHRWQVVRVFDIRRINRMGAPAEKMFNEIFQIWISPKGKEIVASLPYSSTFYNWRWIYGKPFEIKAKYSHGYDKFGVKGLRCYPRVKVLPIVERNGWSRELLHIDVDIARAISLLLTSNDAETAAKTKQFSMLRMMQRRTLMTIPHKQSFNICNRNGYIIPDANIWCDLIDTLEYLNIDTHNAHYVCPENLSEAHDRYERIRARVELRKKKEEQRKMIAEADKLYAKMRSRFFGIVIEDDEVSCSVLQSVSEFLSEGEAMHHCVFDNRYYDTQKHPNALILSARDKQTGKRIETIEVNLASLQIVQSRGRFNKSTSQHNHILTLINNNINVIKKAI